MKFLIDASLSYHLARGLRDIGYDAVHVRDYDMRHASDQEIFDRASTEERIIISKDTDFGMLLALQAANKPSVILFRWDSLIRSEQQIRVLQANLPDLSDALVAGSLVIIEPSRIRVRPLPIHP